MQVNSVGTARLTFHFCLHVTTTLDQFDLSAPIKLSFKAKYAIAEH